MGYQSLCHLNFTIISQYLRSNQICYEKHVQSISYSDYEVVLI